MAASVSALVSEFDNEYQIAFEPSTQRIRATFDDVVIADSNEVRVLYETRHAPVYYFPKNDVNQELLQQTEYITHCPFKGNATHFSIQTAEGILENAAWSYQSPYNEVEYIKSYVAFYTDKIDSILVGETKRSNDYVYQAKTYNNPLTHWLLTEAWSAIDAKTLVELFSRSLVNAGYPVFRFFITIRTLHPLLTGVSYTWLKESDEVKTRDIEHEVIQSEQYKSSPLYPIFQGAGGIRRRLDRESEELDFPILHELKKEGATDYVAMPMSFSNGQINVVTLTADRPGGFSTQELGHLYEIMPLLSRLFEVHAAHYTSSALLDTYLGKYTGQQVLEGKVKRGDGENIYAIIWFCDLRDSTPLAESMSRQEFLGVLNRFFDGMGDAVLNHGGEILRFIGDAALAIFPVSQRSIECHELDKNNITIAGRQALAAALEAKDNMTKINIEREAKNRVPLKFGLGLHIGDVTYGNIGTSSRLEFTVIGSAANEAARIESMCKTLNQPVLISNEFAKHFPGEFKSLGNHILKGIKETQEIFTLE